MTNFWIIVICGLTGGAIGEFLVKCYYRPHKNKD